MDETFCSTITREPPCLIYFTNPFSVLGRIKGNIDDYQLFRNDHIAYVDPKSLPEGERKLLLLSGIDAVIVLKPS